MCDFFDAVKCRAELASANKKLKLLTADNNACQEQVKIIGDNYASALKKLGEAEAKIALLTDGPEPPPADRLRVINIALLHQLYQEGLGQPYIDAYNRGDVNWSDSHFLAPQEEDVSRYCRFLKEYWLPIVKPYTVVEWETLNGDIVDIAQCDCDEFSDWFQGKSAEHGLWAAIAWGLIWAHVVAPLLKGNHAFNNVPTWKEPYDEQRIVGLTLWHLEPQVLGTFPVDTPNGRARIGQVVDITPKPLKSATWTVSDIGLMKT